MQDRITVPYPSPTRRANSSALGVGRCTEDYSAKPVPLKPRVAVEVREHQTLVARTGTQGYANGQPEPILGREQGLLMPTAPGSGAAALKLHISRDFRVNLR